MLTVYFVDDDVLILEELKHIIDWNKYDFTIVGCNTNPLNAMEEIVKLDPTLVICDVQMDGLSGLELAYKLSKLVKSKFVFLSAYDRFDYAVEAIKIGALRYIKKPIKKNSLIELIDEIRNNKIDEFNTQFFNKMTESINRLEYQKNVTELFQNNVFFPQNIPYRLISVRYYGGSTNILDLIKKHSSLHQILYNDGTLVLIIAFEFLSISFSSIYFILIGGIIGIFAYSIFNSSKVEGNEK